MRTPEAGPAAASFAADYRWIIASFGWIKAATSSRRNAR
jgi:hypothetical protein